jgi:hypothetical protein
MIDQTNQNPNSTIRQEGSPDVAVPSPIGYRIFFGCYMSMVFIYLGVIGILSLLGLIIGNFHVPVRGGTGFDLQGTWARVVSAVALLYVAWSLFSIIKKWRRPRSK